MPTPNTPTTIVDNTTAEPPSRPAIAELENGRLFQWNNDFYRKLQAPSTVSTSPITLRKFVPSTTAQPDGDEVNVTLPGNVVIDQLVSMTHKFDNLAP